MTNETLFKILAVVSPFAASGITYLLTLRSKKNEYLYQNRLPAFKEVASVLIKIRRYCVGKMAEERGAEFSPYYDENGSGLMFVTELADVRQLNEIFLTDKSKALLDTVDIQLNLLCHAEMSFFGAATREEGLMYIGNAYSLLLEVVEGGLKGLYKEVGLPNK